MQSHSIDLPIAMDRHPSCLWVTASQTQLSACSKNYKAKGSIYVSIFDQWLLWSGSRPAVQTWSRGCQALVRKKHWTRWQQGTTSHGDVEDMELSDTPHTHTHIYIYIDGLKRLTRIAHEPSRPWTHEALMHRNRSITHLLCSWMHMDDISTCWMHLHVEGLSVYHNMVTWHVEGLSVLP